MADTENQILKLFKDYMSDLSEQGTQGITSYYLEPSMVISPAGVTVLEKNTELIDLFTPMMEQFESQGYERMEALELNAQLLNDSTAIVSNLVARYKSDGSELNRASGTYLLHKNSDGWKIATLVIGDSDSVIQFG